MPAGLPLIELRQYELAPGSRERMIELFDTQFTVAHERAGMPILGLFRVSGDSTRLLWIRGFPAMAARPACLGNFYGGPVWAAFRAEVLGYVRAYDNVQLLRETKQGAGFAVHPIESAARGSTTRAGELVLTTYRLAAAPDAAFENHFNERVLSDSRVLHLGSYVSVEAVNNFPRLPVREGEHLFTWFARVECDLIVPGEIELARYFAAAPERVILEPTAKSPWR